MRVFPEIASANVLVAPASPRQFMPVVERLFDFMTTKHYREVCELQSRRGLFMWIQMVRGYYLPTRKAGHGMIFSILNGVRLANRWRRGL